MIRELWKSASGKAGIILLGILVAGSIAVIATYPPGFGLNVWGNPSVWADYPKSAPPAWVNWFSRRKQPPHRILTVHSPSSVETSARATSKTFTSTIEYHAQTPPQFIAVAVSRVTFHARSPILTETITRPDGETIILFRQVATAPRLGETAPYSRYDTEPLRVVLSGNDRAIDELQNLFATKYHIQVPREAIAQQPEAALFGVPAGSAASGAARENAATGSSAAGSAANGAARENAATGSSAAGGTSAATGSSAAAGSTASTGRQGAGRTFTTLDGEYRFDMQALTADPSDSVGSVTTAVGGTVFGIMGTDALGRDLAVGLMYGLPIALLIGVLTSLVSTAIGMTLGLLSGYVGGTTDLIIQRASDIVANVPVLPLLIFLVFIGGSQLWLILLVLVAFSWPGLTIMVRTMVLQLAGGQEVEAARALGAGRSRIIFRHILPHVGSYVLAQLVFFAPSAILAEAGLSFLGLGDPSIPTWGQILEYGFRTGAVFLGYWWWIVPPGLMIVLTAVTFMFLALGLEPVVDPRLRGRRLWRY